MNETDDELETRIDERLEAAASALERGRDNEAIAQLVCAVVALKNYVKGIRGESTVPVDDGV